MTISATNQGLRPGVCTSTSRPTVPFDGMVIYETDTDLVLAWNGSSWASINQSGASNVDTSQTVTSGSYQDLATIQSVTLTTGTKALVSFGFMFTRPAPESTVYMSFAVSGATTIAAGASGWQDARGYTYTTSDLTVSRTVLVTNLNAGSNTFTAKFARASTNCNVYNRSFSVVAL